MGTWPRVRVTSDPSLRHTSGRGWRGESRKRNPAKPGAWIAPAMYASPCARFSSVRNTRSAFHTSPPSLTRMSASLARRPSRAPSMAWLSASGTRWPWVISCCAARAALMPRTTAEPIARCSTSLAPWSSRHSRSDRIRPSAWRAPITNCTASAATVAALPVVSTACAPPTAATPCKVKGRTPSCAASAMFWASSASLCWPRRVMVSSMLASSRRRAWSGTRSAPPAAAAMSRRTSSAAASYSACSCSIARASSSRMALRACWLARRMAADCFRPLPR